MTCFISRLVWLTLLSCLITTTRSAGISPAQCDIATKSMDATCGVVASITGIAAGVACAVSLGAGCVSFAAVGAVAGICSTAAGAVSCDNDGESFFFIFNLFFIYSYDLVVISTL